NGSVQLQPDKPFTLDTELADDAGDSDQVSVTYPQLPRDVDSGDYLMLDDGRLTLKVETVEGPRIHCRTIVGGELSDHKGINRQGGGLSAEALTDKDKRDIECIGEMGADYVAVSFPRSARDLE